ncbi:AraC family transcriptional regulator [Bdellovibrio sp. qaytius]|nr:AraC family transcriptional regulator [Bdellovibrio sp. qaytius]
MLRMNNIKILHPIEALGVEHAIAGEIRVETLSDRLKPKVDFPHRHDFYQLTFVTKGKGWHEIDFAKHKINGRQIFFMKPGQVHSWVFARGADGFVIEFTRESLPSLSSKSLFLLKQMAMVSDALSFKKESQWKDFQIICELMIKEYSLRSTQYEVCLEGLLQNLLVQLIRVSDKVAQHNTSSSIIDKFQKLVDENFKTQHLVGFYAKKMNMTPKALTMQVSRALKKAPKTVIQDRFILEAKRLLSYSDMSVAEVGYELGFEDANYFTRFFTKAAKVSPSNFRDKVKSLK